MSNKAQIKKDLTQIRKVTKQVKISPVYDQGDLSDFYEEFDQDLADQDSTDQDLTDQDLTNQDLTNQDLTDQDSTNQDSTNQDLTDQNSPEKIQFQDNSLLGICRGNQIVKTGETGEIQKIKFGLILKLDEGYFGHGGKNDLNSTFFISEPDYEYIECRGKKCRKNGYDGVWCLSCFDSPEEDWEDRLRGRINLSDIIPEMVFESRVNITAENSG